MYKLETNPLKRRRQIANINQSEMAEYLGVSQPLYSKIEKGEIDPEKYINKLSEKLRCKPNEIFQGKILDEIEKDFLNMPTKSRSYITHEKKPDYVNIELKGWFTKEDIKNELKYALSCFEEGGLK